jgi:mycofactocin precursor peptide peptidase
LEDRPVTRLDATTWPDAAGLARAGGILVIPVGSTEQHGPHLPVTTDTDIAEAVAVGAAIRLDQVVVAPAVAYGSSGEHQSFAGTLSIGQQVIELVLVELGRSAAIHFSRTVFVSSHGGNSWPLRRAMQRLEAERHRSEAWTPRWGGDLHAGRTETSLMLAIAPDRVDMDRAEPGDRRTAEALLPLLRRDGVQAVSGNGVLGDPGGATAEEGRRLLDRAVDDLTRTLGGAFRPQVGVG